MARTARFISLAALAGVIAFVAWPAPIDPVATNLSPGVELDGPWKPIDRLQDASVLASSLPGPEAIWLERDGTVLTGLADGRVVSIDDEGAVRELANTKGRPLGLARAPDGRLIIADARRGLLALGEDGSVEVLLTEVDGTPLGFTDHLDISRAGVVYVSDASSKFGEGRYMYDLFEGRPHGRLISYDLNTGASKVVLDGLYFANGVALARDESFVLVNETYAHKITKLWLSGDRAGSTETFVDRLPGFPDNLSRGPDGTFWVAFFTERNKLAGWLGPRPFVRGLVAKLPEALWPKPAKMGLVAQLSAQGEVLQVLRDAHGVKVANVTGVRASKKMLTLGTLVGNEVWQIALD